ncbi:hypothetical protein FSP39_010286 [Pinctada imbricata]|uniref:Claudin n=1 Tax=Pinctada imbricata TaxID=66713 RepID=A0AA89C1F2_PINIB|nr:hypothetical protein FSP39_010286 [Pinctada imbricata]
MDRFKEEEEEGISKKMKAGVVVLLVCTLFQVIGVASSHWVVAWEDPFGTLEYTGLWEKCNDLSIGMHQYECRGFIWEDVQVSHWFRTIQTMEAMGTAGLFAVILLLALYLFSPFKGRKPIKYLAVVVAILCGVLIVVSCIVFGSLKQVMKPRYRSYPNVSLSWSFAFSLVGGFLSFVAGVLVCIG